MAGGSLDGPAPFLFVVGCGRSGTTLLRAMLDSHPALAVPPESWFVATLGRRYERRFDRDRFEVDLLAHGRFARWGLDPEAVSRSIRAADPSDVATAVRSVFAAYAASRGKPRYADKTPGYVLDLPLLARLFPEARFLHLVRDGRDVAASVAAGHFGPSSLHQAALYWARHVERGRAAGGDLGPGRYRELHYERLVSDPAAALQEVCAFAGLAFEPAMLDYPARAAAVVAGTGTPGAHHGLTRAPTADLRSWRRDVPEPQVALIEALVAPTLEACGYERAHPRPPAATVVRAACIRRATAARLRLAPGARRARRAVRTWRARSLHGGPATPATGGSAPESSAEPLAEPAVRGDHVVQAGREGAQR